MAESETQVEPVPALAYQPGKEAAGDPWVGVAMAIGWTAAALAAARLCAGVAGMLFRWDFQQRNVTLPGGLAQVLSSALPFYVAVLAGGIATLRLRPGGRKLLMVSLMAVLIVKAVVVVAGAVSGLAFPGGRLGPIGKAGLAGQSVFSSVADAVPLVLLLWLLRRPVVKEVFERPTGPL